MGAHVLFIIEYLDLLIHNMQNIQSDNQTVSSNRPLVSLIVATDINCGISKNGSIPWKFKDDMQEFAKITTGDRTCSLNAVIMGRATWESLPNKGLPNRINYVVSNSITQNDLDVSNKILCEIYLCKSIDDAIKRAQSCNEIFICGGTGIYKEALLRNLVDTVYLTYIPINYLCDNVCEELSVANLEKKFMLVDSRARETSLGKKFYFLKYSRV